MEFRVIEDLRINFEICKILEFIPQLFHNYSI